MIEFSLVVSRLIFREVGVGVGVGVGAGVGAGVCLEEPAEGNVAGLAVNANDRDKRFSPEKKAVLWTVLAFVALWATLLVLSVVVVAAEVVVVVKVVVVVVLRSAAATLG
jgi:hypothetical protein